jgi:hypothetical protein
MPDDEDDHDKDDNKQKDDDDKDDKDDKDDSGDVITSDLEDSVEEPSFLRRLRRRHKEEDEK